MEWKSAEASYAPWKSIENEYRTMTICVEYCVFAECIELVKIRTNPVTPRLNTRVWLGIEKITAPAMSSPPG